MIDSGDSGWMNHPKYGTVYQPDLGDARVNFNTEYDVWHGSEYDTLNDLLNDVQYAAMRTVLTDLLEAMNGGQVGPKTIRAMLDTLADQQHGEQS